MSGFLMLNAIQYYYEPFEVLNMKMLESDTSILQMAEIALQMFLKERDRRGFNQHQEVRIYVEGQVAGDYSVQLAEFTIKELDKWTVHRPKSIQPGLYLIYRLDGADSQFFYSIVDNKIDGTFFEV